MSRFGVSIMWFYLDVTHVLGEKSRHSVLGHVHNYAFINVPASKSLPSVSLISWGDSRSVMSIASFSLLLLSLDHLGAE